MWLWYFLVLGVACLCDYCDNRNHVLCENDCEDKYKVCDTRLSQIDFTYEEKTELVQAHNLMRSQLMKQDDHKRDISQVTDFKQKVILSKPYSLNQIVRLKVSLLKSWF